jgi:hypothetical protein
MILLDVFIRCHNAGLMKKALLIPALLLTHFSAGAQGTLNFSPVPVTNGVTGVPGDSSIVAAIYYAPNGTAESGLVLLSPPIALVGGYARFGNGVVFPLAGGTTIELEIRAWSSPYTSFEAAVASQDSSVLAGQSLLVTAGLGGSIGPPPLPDPLAVPGFTIYPVPEPATVSLVLGGGVLLFTVYRTQKQGPISSGKAHVGVR